MRDMKTLVADWFEKWKTGDYPDLPISEKFKHTSPFGTIDGKKAYLDLVAANKDKFLGYRFDIHDGIYGADNGCVRYTAVQGEFTLNVSEWYYRDGDAIGSIVSYYHIGEIREERKLSDPGSE